MQHTLLYSQEISTLFEIEGNLYTCENGGMYGIQIALVMYVRLLVCNLGCCLCSTEERCTYEAYKEREQ